MPDFLPTMRFWPRVQRKTSNVGRQNQASYLSQTISTTRHAKFLISFFCFLPFFSLTSGNGLSWISTRKMFSTTYCKFGAMPNFFFFYLCFILQGLYFFYQTILSFCLACSAFVWYSKPLGFPFPKAHYTTFCRNAKRFADLFLRKAKWTVRSCTWLKRNWSCAIGHAMTCREQINLYMPQSKAVYSIN